MKKIFAFLCLIPALAIFSGCKKLDNFSLLKQNLSETNEVYFASDGAIKVSVTSGKREEPYLYDGKSCDKLDFALVTAVLDGSDDEMVNISINGQGQDVLMQFNFLTGKHVADLERKLDGSEEIIFTYMDKTSSLKCLSDDFEVDHNKALELGYEHLKQDVDNMCSDGVFNGEAYLRIVDDLSGGFLQPYWLFSLLDQGKAMKNLIISTSSPQVVADGKQVVI